MRCRPPLTLVRRFASRAAAAARSLRLWARIGAVCLRTAAARAWAPIRVAARRARLYAERFTCMCSHFETIGSARLLRSHSAIFFLRTGST